MNTLAPVSSIMSTHLITVNAKDRLSIVGDIFEKMKIHHIPVVQANKMVGIISKSDFLQFMKGLGKNSSEKKINEIRLNHYNAEVIMTRDVVPLEPTDSINAALDIFVKNIFRALPVVKGDQLVGIITTYDIIK